jgi:hypothetical protein
MGMLFLGKCLFEKFLDFFSGLMKKSRETPQALKALRRIKGLPAESECLERKSTGKVMERK